MDSLTDILKIGPARTLERWCATHPDALAVASLTRQLTYQQLNDHANAIASWIINTPVKSNVYPVLALLMDDVIDQLI